MISCLSFIHNWCYRHVRRILIKIGLQLLYPFFDQLCHHKYPQKVDQHSQSMLQTSHVCTDNFQSVISFALIISYCSIHLFDNHNYSMSEWKNGTNFAINFTWWSIFNLVWFLQFYNDNQEQFDSIWHVRALLRHRVNKLYWSPWLGKNTSHCDDDLLEIL